MTASDDVAGDHGHGIAGATADRAAPQRHAHSLFLFELRQRVEARRPVLLLPTFRVPCIHHTMQHVSLSRPSYSRRSWASCIPLSPSAHTVRSPNSQCHLDRHRQAGCCVERSSCGRHRFLRGWPQSSDGTSSGFTQQTVRTSCFAALLPAATMVSEYLCTRRLHTRLGKYIVIAGTAQFCRERSP